MNRRGLAHGAFIGPDHIEIEEMHMQNAQNNLLRINLFNIILIVIHMIDIIVINLVIILFSNIVIMCIINALAIIFVQY